MISCGLRLCRMYTGITKCFQFEEGALQPCGVLTQNSGILGSVLFQFPSSIPNKITSGIELGTPCATACGKDPGSVAAAGQPNANDDIPCDMGAAMAVSRIRSLCAESASNTSLYWRLLLPDVWEVAAGKLQKKAAHGPRCQRRDVPQVAGGRLQEVWVWCKAQTGSSRFDAAAPLWVVGGGPQEAQIQGAQKGNVTAASKLIVLTAPGGCEKMLAKAYKNFARWALDPLVNGIIYIYIYIYTPPPHDPPQWWSIIVTKCMGTSPDHFLCQTNWISSKKQIKHKKQLKEIQKNMWTKKWMDPFNSFDLFCLSG